jgi:hypothetical protein
MLADIDPFSLGTISLEFDKMLSSAVEKKDAAVFFDPRINSVYLEFRYQSVKYTQYWDKEARDLFIAALAHYHADYDAKNLISKDSKTRAIYGRFKGMTQWGTFNFSTKGKSYPECNLGYTFKQGKPYFSVFQREALDVTPESNEQKKSSLQIRTYFTRSQADELAQYFDYDYLIAALGKYGKTPFSDATVPSDEPPEDIDIYDN